MNKTLIEYLDYNQGWIEAMIDAEGSLSLIKRKRVLYRGGFTYSPILNIGNKDRRLLEKAQKIIGAGFISKPNPHGVMNYYASSETLRKFLPQLSLISKESQRRLLLEALHILSRHAGRSKPRTDLELIELEKIYLKMARLNGGRFLRE